MSWINDPVNSPKHYTDSHPGMECIDLTADTTFCLGNCCKYLWRYHSKGRPLEDLEKARWYLCRVIDEVKAIILQAHPAPAPEKPAGIGDNRRES